jgi:tRNA threonylcarbamoyladenosine biosynthesis protein TsaB
MPESATSYLIAIETSADVCSIAGFIDRDLVGYQLSEEPRSHSTTLASMIQGMLKNNLHDRLDCIAVSAGPGSFTGLRIGVSTAKGLAFGRTANIVAVSTLESVACGVFRVSSNLPACCVVAPSRKGEVYFGFYERGAGTELVQIEMEKAVTIAEFEAIRAVRSGIPVFQTTAGLLADAAGVVKPDAREVGYCALPRVDRKQFEDTSAFEPYYLKVFHAKKPSKSALDRLPF